MKKILIGSLVVVALVGCGLPESDPGAGSSTASQSLTPALSPIRRLDVSDREVSQRSPQAAARLSPFVSPHLQVHDFAAPDGARVRYLLGMVGCGILVVAEGEATVQDGRFQVPYDASQSQGWQLELFLHVDTDGTGTCVDGDPVLTVPQVTVSPGGLVDASNAQASYVGCWIFQGWGG